MCVEEICQQLPFTKIVSQLSYDMPLHWLNGFNQVNLKPVIV